MYTGIKTNGSAHDYASAQRVLEQAALTPTGRQRQSKEYGFPLGGHSKSVTWVRELDDGAIAFRLWDTDVVIWYPDNSFDVENYGTVTTSQFARRFLPAGIWLNHPVTKRGVESGAKTITYRGRDEAGSSVQTKCIGYVVRFNETGDGRWVPDEDTLDTMKFVELDRTKAREVAQVYHLKDFENWLSMAPMHLAGTEAAIEHDKWDRTTCADALMDRDFRRAAEHLPLIKDTNAFGIELKPLPITTGRWGHHVTMSSFNKLKLALWDYDGALDTTEVKTISVKDYDRRMVRVREMRQLGLGGWDLGAQ